MTKEELREKTFAVYRKMYKTDKKPDTTELAKMLNILGQAVRCCSDAKDELGSEFYTLIKKCTRANKTGMEVLISKFLTEIGYFDEPELEDIEESDALFIQYQMLVEKACEALYKLMDSDCCDIHDIDKAKEIMKKAMQE